jgi:hypothetical protein
MHIMMRPFLRSRALAALFVTATAAALALAPSFAQSPPPFKVYSGSVGHFEITKGVNTIKVNDGFLSTGTVASNSKGVYRIKPGQALALLYQGKSKPGETGVDFGKVVTGNYGKVIRKVDGQEVKMDNYLGVETRFEITWINKPHEDAYGISRKYKSKFSPPLPASDFDRADGIILINSPDPTPALKVPAFAKDVNKVAGKVLTVYYLASPIDAEPFLTVEVDFTGVQPGSLSSATKPGASSEASAANGQKASEDRAAAQQSAAAAREDQKKQREEERAAAKDAKTEARADAAAERAKKRAEAAAARKIVP